MPQPATILTTTSSFSLSNFPSDYEVVHNPYRRRLTESEIAELIEQYQPVGMIAGVEPLTRAVLEKAKRLKVISRCGIGTDSVDLEAVKDLGIVLTITPNAPTASVAELTVGLILDLSRRISQLDAGIRAGRWKGPAGTLVRGKTVGIVGCGRIGTYVARLLQGFECSLLGFDPFAKNHRLCTMVELDELLRKSDIVTLHLPYGPQTHHIIGTSEFSIMQSHAFLVNAARGGLIDETALATALAEEKLGGAALDCFSEEPYRGELTRFENVVLTPHVGSSAREARREMEEEALKNLIAQLEKTEIG
jgi:D-3-phosphoglycerate dehydrogenase